MADRVLLLHGDGVGPEVSGQARRVLDTAVAEAGVDLAIDEGQIGGASWEAHGTFCTDETVSAHAVPSRRGRRRRPDCSERNVWWRDVRPTPGDRTQDRDDLASRVERAVASATLSTRTRDLGGRASTIEMADAVLRSLEQRMSHEEKS